MKFPLQDWRILARAIYSVFIITHCTHAEEMVEVGAARVDISPSEPVVLMGYAARAKLPPPGEVAQRIYARGLAIGADPDPTLLVTVDNCILPAAISEEVKRRVAEKFHIPSERIALSVTHTHSAPWLTGAAPNIFGADISPPQQAQIDAYTRFLVERLHQVASAALADRKGARLAWGKGSVTFAKNRRTPSGPVDHQMPLLRVTTPEGRVRAVFINYACHCTTLGGDFNAVHGDWAGIAAEAIEEQYPDAIALVAIGCGADANPDPRGTLVLATQHGEEVAREASRLLGSQLTPLGGRIEAKAAVIQLPFATHFDAEEWKQRSEQPGIVGYHATKWLARMSQGAELPKSLPYPVQTWNFGEQLAMVFLGGEVVVDYSTRLKAELDPARLWVNGYSNAVPCYIPSRRILAEGGYEAETSLWYYDQPQRLAPEVEDLIVNKVREMVPAAFISSASSGK